MSETRIDIRTAIAIAALVTAGIGVTFGAISTANAESHTSMRSRLATLEATNLTLTRDIAEIKGYVKALAKINGVNVDDIADKHGMAIPNTEMGLLDPRSGARN